VGANGSGKSTLLQIIAGAIAATEGVVRYSAGREIAPEHAYRQLSLSAPYLELIEEMTAMEFLRFHHAFKPFLASHSPSGILDTVGLATAAEKQIRFFSSGMKQRLKLAQAIYSDTSAILLDEPCTNLDAEGVALYQSIIRQNGNDRLVIVSSNDPQEYDFCETVLDIRRYKQPQR
ncbi:MAG TPA: ATP-binding cassette domain-containing protein, partial [Puia sp.]|nr:ATP-binding cassette domain-containing protein [Puia sp.]